MTDRRIIQAPVTWDSANRKKDRSVSFRFTSNLEIPNDQFALMDQLVLSDGWMLFAENELKEPDIPKDDAPREAGRKSKSEILRAVLYKRWVVKTDRSEEFDHGYYPRMMQRIIDYYGRDLDD